MANKVQSPKYWKSLSLKSSLSQGALLHRLIHEAEAIVIGIGAGMSAASGFTYVGERFEQAFPDFIKKYRFLDMLQASLHDFEDELAYWAFQSRFTMLNFYDQPVGQTYVDLKKLIEGKEYHIITTNADNAFYAADYPLDQVFYIQGEYKLLQCSHHCHQQTYEAEALLRKMVAQQSNMKIPKSLVPYCPKCGEGLEINKRTEEKGMVEDANFHAQKERYEHFLNKYKHKKTMYLEIGVGHTTPQFIKHPFQQMTEKNPQALLVTMNHRNYFIPHAIRPQTVHINEEIADVLQIAAQKES